MSGESGAGDQLATGIAGIYTGPLDTFVRRRDALAKELRSAGRREEAAAVKRLRKPARIAWALDVASVEQPDAVGRVAAAVEATLVAQSGDGDLRTALSELKDAVHTLAGTAARAAAGGGYSIDHADLVDAVMAVIGAGDAFEVLRAGRLVDVPEAGRLDFLSGSPSNAGTAIAPRGAASAGRAAPEPASLEALRRAERSLTAARRRLAAAERALREAEANAETAERTLLLARGEARARRADLASARDEADSAAAEVAETETALARARNNAPHG